MSATDIVTIPAKKREAIGTKQVNALRGEGLVPCVIYGRGGEPTHASIQESDLDRELRRHNRVLKLDVDGSQDSVYMQDVQFDVLSDQALHVDFLRIDLEKELELEVEINFRGHAAGLAKGGRLVKDLEKLQVKAWPWAVPHQFEVNVTSLDVGQSIAAGDVDLGADVSLNCPADAVVCHIPDAEG